MVVVLVAAMCRQARLQGLMSISFWRPTIHRGTCPARQQAVYSITRR